MDPAHSIDNLFGKEIIWVYSTEIYST